jgi:hypothetical protein
MRCPYLEQILRKRAVVLKVFQADCHADRRVHRFHGVVRWPTPPCLGQPATCLIYQEARATEDLALRRLND